ncbi:MAG: hypothetical protein GXO84_07235 [Chlorobi bacterium]|nr:hypothetical protein [Chlorobiota bacterium]
MKTVKQILGLLIMLVFMMSFSQCSSTKKLQEKAPIAIGKVYVQKWVAGIEGGGSGLYIFIPVSDVSITLDSVYFRGKATKLSVKYQNKNMYVGNFINPSKQKHDIIMSGDSKAEYGNKLPPSSKEQKPIPFELKDDECVISYIDGKKTKYFKVGNIVEKQLIPYPSAPHN